MLRVDFMFADSTTDFILVIFDYSSLLIGVQVWSPILIVWLSLSLISTDAMTLHKPPVEQSQIEIPYFHWNFRVNFCPSNSSPFWPRIVVVVLADSIFGRAWYCYLIC